MSELHPIRLEYINPYYTKENEDGNVANTDNGQNAE